MELRIGDRSFKLKAAIPSVEEPRVSFIWNNPSLNWSVDDEVSVSLLETRGLTAECLTVSEPLGEDFVDEVERVEVGSAATANIGIVVDTDPYRVNLDGGTTYWIDMEAIGEVDPQIVGITDSKGVSIPSTTVSSDGGEGNNERFNFTPTQTGRYHIVFGSAGLSTGTYRLRVRHVALPGQTVLGQFQFYRDTDWFGIDLEQGKRYEIVANVASVQDPIRINNVYDPIGSQISVDELLDATGGRTANIYEFAGGSVAYFAPDAPDFQEAGELKGDALAKAVRILKGSGVPGGNPVQLG